MRTSPASGRFLFEKGFYVQSVTFPAVPYHAGVLRIQINANHEPAAIDGLLGAPGGIAAQVRAAGRGAAAQGGVSIPL